MTRYFIYVLWLGPVYGLLQHDFWLGVVVGVLAPPFYFLMHKWQEKSALANATMLQRLSEEQRQRVLAFYSGIRSATLSRTELEAVIHYVDFENNREWNRRTTNIANAVFATLCISMAACNLFNEAWVVGPGWLIYLSYITLILRLTSKETELRMASRGKQQKPLWRYLTDDSRAIACDHNRHSVTCMIGNFGKISIA